LSIVALRLDWTHQAWESTCVGALRLSAPGAA